MGAPWIDERELAKAVNDANPPGVRVLPIRFTPNASKFKGEECHGLSFVITDWNEFRSFEFGLTIAHALRKLYPKQWETDKLMRLLGNKQVLEQIDAGKDVHEILAGIEKDLAKFRKRKKEFELYK